MLFTIIIVFSACSIEKKHASFGYHIEWRNNKFSEGNKPIAHKAKAVKEKAIITPNETDLIIESKANSVEANSSMNNELVSASNEIVNFEANKKTKTISNNQASIIKNSNRYTKGNRPTKNIFSIQRNEGMPLLFYIGSIIFVVCVLSLAFRKPGFGIGDDITIYSLLFAFLGFCAIVLGFLIYIVRFFDVAIKLIF